MKMHAYVAGIGMTRFGNHLTVKLKDLAAEAIREALMDSGLNARDIQAAYMGNASAGVIQGQEMIRGQAVLRAMSSSKPGMFFTTSVAGVRVSRATPL